MGKRRRSRPPPPSPPVWPEADAFLHDILERPEDDTPRLIYADWLDEHADPDRAAFVRVQCEIEKAADADTRWWEALRTFHPPRVVGEVEPSATSDCWWALKRRERELLDRHFEEWTRPVAAILPQVARGLEHPRGRTRHEPHFRRGFVEHLSLRSGLQWRANRESLSRLAPVRSLHVDTFVTDEFTERENSQPQIEAFLAESPARLKELSVHDDLPGYNVFPIVAGSDRLGDLTALEILLEMPYGDERDWGVGNVPVAAEGLRALAGAAGLSRLTALWVFAYGHFDENLRAVVDSTVLDGLRELALRASLSDAGARALAAARGVERLRSLHLDRVGEAGFVALVGSPRFRELRRLRLTSWDLTGERMGTFLQWPALGQLSALSLQTTTIDPPRFEALAACPALRGLRALDLNGSVHAAGIQALAASPALAELRRLDLRGTFSSLYDTHDATHAALTALAESPHLPNLRELHLEPAISDSLARKFATAPTLAWLERLVVSEVEPDGEATLRDRFGDRVEIGRVRPAKRKRRK